MTVLPSNWKKALKSSDVVKRKKCRVRGREWEQNWRGCGLSISPLAHPNCNSFGALVFSLSILMFHLRSQSQRKSRAEPSQTQSQSESQSKGKRKEGKQIGKHIAMQ